MKIHKYNKTLDDNYDYFEISKLDEDELNDIRNKGVDEIWYWYAVGSYEGTGELLMRKDNKFFIHHLGHCSCYGPTDYINIQYNDGYRSLEEIQEKLSEESYRDIYPLVEMAKRS